MKFKVSLKDPDGFYEGRMDAVRTDIEKIPGLSEDEKEALIELRHEKLYSEMSKFVRYGEYVTIEFDTEAGTATVVPSK